MSENEIYEKLKSIVKEQMGIEEDKITMDATLIDDLSADSLDIVELIMIIEEEFNIEIPDSETENIFTIRDVVEYIQSK